jgi:hypothetical protein
MPVGSHQPPLTQPGASPSDTLAAGGDFLSLVQMRLATQNQRIADGVASGVLSDDTASQLYAMERNVQNTLGGLESSGDLSPQDRWQMLEMINRASGQILLAKHPEIAQTLTQDNASGLGSIRDGALPHGGQELKGLAPQLNDDPNLSQMDKGPLGGFLERAGGPLMFSRLLQGASQGEQADSGQATGGQNQPTGAAASAEATSGHGGPAAAVASSQGSSDQGAGDSDQLASLEQEQAQLEQELAAAQADPNASNEKINALEGALAQIRAQVNQARSSSKNA